MRKPEITILIFPILLSLTGGPAGKGGGQQDKNDGGALNFDPDYDGEKKWNNTIKREFEVKGFGLRELY